MRSVWFPVSDRMEQQAEAGISSAERFWDMGCQRQHPPPNVIGKSQSVDSTLDAAGLLDQRLKPVEPVLDLSFSDRFACETRWLTGFVVHADQRTQPARATPAVERGSRPGSPSDLVCSMATPSGPAVTGSTPPQSNPCSLETLLPLGQQALERRDWPQATRVFGQLVRTEPTAVQAWLGLGIAALEQKRYRLAQEALEQARCLAPGDPYVAVNLAGLLRVLGRSAKALPLALQASALLPNEPLVQLNRWLLEQDLGGLETAAEGYGALARRWPRLPQAHYHLGHAHLVQGRLAEAEISLRQALTLQPGDGAAHQALVGLHLQRGEAELALQRVEAHRRQRPYDGYDLALRCLALRNLGREAEAAPLDDTGAWLSAQRLERRQCGGAEAALRQRRQWGPALGGSRQFAARALAPLR